MPDVGLAGYGRSDPGLIGRLRSAFFQHLEPPDLAGVPDRVKAEISLEQAVSVARLFPLFALSGIVTLVVVAFAVRHEPVAPRVVVISALIFFLYSVILYRVRGWHRLADRRQGASVFLRRLAVLVAFLGLGWAALSTLIVTSDQWSQRDLLFGVDIGVTSSSVLLMPRQVAFACWCPAVVGGIVAAWWLSAQFGPLAAVAFAVYGILIASAILFTNRSLVMRTITRIHVEEQGEVIGLLLRDFEENASDWLWETDRLLRLSRVSARLAKVSGKPAALLQGLSLRTLLLSLTDRAGEDGEMADIIRCLDARAPLYNREVRLRINGQDRYWNMVCEPVIDGAGEFQGYRGIGSDITNAKRSQREIAFLARHDVLTGLPNRRLFGELLHAACETSSRHPFTLLCVDLDRFKDINDRFGHSGGDALLVVVAQRLRDSVRQIDSVARLGGDEFAVILHTVSPAEVDAVIRRILESIALPLHVQGTRVEIAASIGAACAPQDAQAASMLLQNADLALYESKHNGRGTWRFFAREMAESLADRQSIEHDLRRAIENNELFLEYQPIVSLPDGVLRGAEALVRWAHPTRGRLGPDRFIAIAEQTGLIVALGAWVLLAATREAARWPRALQIAVNMSAIQLRDRNVAGIIDTALSASGLAPERLEIEITETALLSATHATDGTLHGIRRRGVRIALDDFGIGFSSLSHVCSFPFNKIKISQDFVAEIEARRDKQAVVQAIADLGRRLGITTTVEGIETRAQLGMVRSTGCTEAQGYLFSRPVSAEAFRGLCKEDCLLAPEPAAREPFLQALPEASG